MPHYRQLGEVPRKRHTQFRRPDGGLFTEELAGAEGFSSDSSLLYHREPPTAVVDVEAVEVEPEDVTANHPLTPRHLKAHDLKVGGDVVTGRHLLLANEDVRISYVAAVADSPLTRNAVGDELVFVESGTGELQSSFGRLRVGPGDYVVVPTSTVHRWVVDGPELRVLVLESRGHVGPPEKYLSRRGQFLEHAPYCERDLRAPDELLDVDGGDVEVLVRTRAGVTRYVHLTHPFDVVGWDGCLYPYALNIADFEPIVGRIHQPPPVHQTFAGPGRGRLLVRAAALRLAPPGDPRPVQPRQRRLRRGPLLRRRGLHEPQGLGHRRGVAVAAPPRVHPRPAARQRRGLHRCRAHRGDGRDDRHLPTAGPGPGRA